MQSRASAIRCLLDGLVGLVSAANANDSTKLLDDTKKPFALDRSKTLRVSLEASRKERSGEETSSRRTRVPSDIWQDTLSLLCDSDPSVRKACANALIFYIIQEMPKYGESTDPEGTTHLRRLAEGAFRHVHNMFPNVGDVGTKFLNIVHAYVYILAASPTLGLSASSDASRPPTGDSLKRDVGSTSENHESGTDNGNVTPSTSNNRRSFASQNAPKARKQSLVLKLVENAPSRYTTSAKASEEDYASLLKVLTTIQVQLPMRGLVTGVPMLLALDEASNVQEAGSDLAQRIIAVKTVIAHVWLVIGQVWKLPDLVMQAEQVGLHLSHSFCIMITLTPYRLLRL